MLETPTITSLGGCIPSADQIVSAPSVPRMAMATARVNAPALFGPVPPTSPTTKTTMRGPVPSTATLFYGVVGVDNVARSLQATRRDGIWLDAGDVPQPSGALVFAAGPSARGWMVANMGASSRVCEAGAEPVGRVP